MWLSSGRALHPTKGVAATTPRERSFYLLSFLRLARRGAATLAETLQPADSSASDIISIIGINPFTAEWEVKVKETICLDRLP